MITFSVKHCSHGWFILVEKNNSGKYQYLHKNLTLRNSPISMYLSRQPLYGKPFRHRYYPIYFKTKREAYTALFHYLEWELSDHS